MSNNPPDGKLLAEIIDVLAGIAPEIRDSVLDPDTPLRDQLELDSMDHVHFTVDLHERFGVDIPESDYRAMHCLRELAAYIGARRAP
jgi:acyl carrier protein